MRDGEHLRGWMTGRFRAELSTAGVPRIELTGPYRRLTTAVEACDALLARGWHFAPPLLPADPSVVGNVGGAESGYATTGPQGALPTVVDVALVVRQISGPARRHEVIWWTMG